MVAPDLANELPIQPLVAVLFLKPVPKVRPQLFDLRLGNVQDIRLAGIQRCVVLVVVFGHEEFLQRFESRYDGTIEHTRLVQLPNIGLRDTSLLVVRIEDCRAILPASVVALTVQRRWIVRNREVDLEELAIA